jgi:hypothetical protein
MPSLQSRQVRGTKKHVILPTPKKRGYNRSCVRFCAQKCVVTAAHPDAWCSRALACDIRQAAQQQ